MIKLMPAWSHMSVIVCLTCMMTCGTTVVGADRPDESPTVVFLVRHAEKMADGDDPGLTEEGQHRAEQLAVMLRDAKLDYVHSSDYKRTRETAEPVARQFELEVGVYDARDLAALAESLRQLGGRHLVVGHSNTTPDVVKILGGEPGSPIYEPSEYDRLYMLTISPDGSTQTVLLRFGKPFEGE